MDSPAPGPRAVELRPPRRRRELILIVAAVAVVAGVGLLGDESDDDAQASPTTTTSRRAGRAQVIDDDDRTTRTTRRRVPRSTSSTGPTTTTSWPQLAAGTGPLLPGEPTGTVVGLTDPSGHIVVVDLDTGDRCTTMSSRDGAWLPWLDTTADDRIVVMTGDRVVSIDRGCAMRDLPLLFRDSYAAAVTTETVWLGQGDGPSTLTEVRIDTGEPTGREVELPRYSSPVVLVAGSDLVLGALGSMTLVDPDTDERTDLGPGNPLAVHGDVLAFTTCPEMRCRLELLDLTTRDRRVVTGIEPVSWDASLFSPDGRLLRIAVPDDDEQPSTAIVDVASGEVRVIDTPAYGTQFTSDNRWLLGIENGRAIAIRVDGTVPNIELAPDIRDVQSFGLL